MQALHWALTIQLLSIIAHFIFHCIGETTLGLNCVLFVRDISASRDAEVAEFWLLPVVHLSVLGKRI